MSLRSLMVDFNAFFASVEQQLRPELRGRPVGVVPVMAESTSCIAASYEAKKFGVKTGTRVSDARKMCPGLRVVEARPEQYVKFHHQLVAAVDTVVPVADVLSIDEMVCDLTGDRQEQEKAVALARLVKQTILDRVGSELHCSIGIAPNPFLAKTASDMQKPNGLVVIEMKDLPHCLHRLELRDLCGIGENMEQRLHRHQIRTVEALCSATREQLRKVWGGVEGERMYRRLRGEIVELPPTTRRTLGHSHVLPPRLRNETGARSVLQRLLQKAAMRLRKEGLLTSAMQITIKDATLGYWSLEGRFSETDDTLVMIRILSALWERRPPKMVPLSVGINLIHLIDPKLETPSLFFDPSKSPALNRAIDRLNLLFGKHTVYFGGAHSALDSAPMRIAFTRIPDVETEGNNMHGSR